MKTVRVTVLVLCLTALNSACASTVVRTEATQQIAHCPVCTHNNDLACETVEVNATTPSALHEGTTYHFCSDKCRARFLEEPAAYVPE